MDQEQHKSVLVGVFPSKTKAESAARSLRKLGLSSEQISLYPPKQGETSTLRAGHEFRSFSEEQLKKYEEDLEAKRSILSVTVYGEPDEVIAIMDKHGAVQADSGAFAAFGPAERTLPLHEEQLRVEKQTHEIGEIVVRKVIEDVPTQAEVDAIHEELDVEHVSVDEVVQRRREPWREGNVLVVPVYEEQMVVVRQLVMREQLRISLHQVTEKHFLADTLKREHVTVEDPAQTGRVKFNQGSAEPGNNDDDSGTVGQVGN
jgi:uncharacterized protein (TIGR02271 family)